MTGMAVKPRRHLSGNRLLCVILEIGQFFPQFVFLPGLPPVSRERGIERDFRNSHVLLSRCPGLFLHALRGIPQLGVFKPAAPLTCMAAIRAFVSKLFSLLLERRGRVTAIQCRRVTLGTYGGGYFCKSPALRFNHNWYGFFSTGQLTWQQRRLIIS